LKELAYLNKYFWKYKFYFLGGIIFTIISNLFGIKPAQMVREALDTVKDNLKLLETAPNKAAFYAEIVAQITYFGVLILLMAIAKGVFLFAVRQTLIVMSRHIEYDLKNEIYEHYQTLPLSFYKQQKIGDLMARISEDVGKVRMYIGPSIMYLLNMVVLVVLILSYMFSVNVRLSLYVLIPMPVLSLSIYLVSSVINKKSEEIQKNLASVSVFSQESFTGIRILKAFYRNKAFLSEFEQESKKYRNSSIGLAKIDALFSPVIGFLIGLCTIICVYVGGQEIIAGRLSTGNIAEFIIYVYMLTWPLTALGWTSGQIQRAAASQKRINEFLKIKSPLVSKKNVDAKINGYIKLKNVSFTYPETGIEALKDISFELMCGETLAVLGPTGSGKSTLAQMLFRMYDTSSGAVYFDDLEIKDIALDSLRKQIAYVPQDVFLFSDSIKNNISFGLGNKEQVDIEKYAGLAAVHDNIMQLDQKYETVVGERGLMLSGGQKQRISIARALIKESKIIILDDCLSAVDTQTESEILQNLKDNMQKISKVIISHRVSNAKYADKIAFLVEGRLLGYGTHAELYSSIPEYKDFCDIQLEEKTMTAV
jgi:ATP-binding cassette, subfamily B, multidrug efflux pump